jgi:hypothetical protein
MHTHRVTRLLALIFFAAFAQAASAQPGSSPQPAVTTSAALSTAAAPLPAAPRPPRQSNFSFISEKPVLGLPLGTNRPRAHCSVDGTAFFDLTASSARAGQDIYGISLDGSVKHLLRKLPIDYTNVSVRDLFTGDGQIVTLLQADKRDTGTEASPPRETDYFIALEDTAGDLSDLIQLQLRFKPVRVARFGNGDIVILGWDEGNLLPVLASVRTDGTPHRFIDFDTARPSLNAQFAARAEQRATLDMLQGASFVASGSDILLTYPGTTKPIRRLTSSGETFTIPIFIPGGYVLNDILVSSGPRFIVRVKELPPASPPPADAADRPPRMLVLEEDARSGALVREIIFSKPTPADLTCAPNSTLSAIFYDAIPDTNHSQATDPAAAPPTQLVVSTTRR